MTRPQVDVVETGADLAADVADRTIDVLVEAQKNGRIPSLVLTAGSILEKVFAAIPAAATASLVDWSQVDVFWGDERFVPDGSPERNDTPAKAMLFSALPFDPARLHQSPTSDGAWPDPDVAARAYNDEIGHALGHQPVFDLALIGMGPDGHCCSLFPHHPGLDVDDRWIAAIHDSPKPPPTRLTFTFRALAQVQRIWFVNSGQGKADAVADLLREKGVAHALIDLDGLRRFWPNPADDPFGHAKEIANLAAVARTYLQAGAQRLVLAGVVGDAATYRDYRETLGLDDVVVCRLRIDPDLGRARVARRHELHDGEREWHLHRFAELDALLDEAAIEDVTVQVGRRRPEEVARDVLAAVGW